MPLVLVRHLAGTQYGHLITSKYSFIQSSEESLIVANINFKRIWKFNMSPRPLSLLMNAS